MPRTPKSNPKKRSSRTKAAASPPSTRQGGWTGGLLLFTIFAAFLPLFAPHFASDTGASTGFLMPLLFWGSAYLGLAWIQRAKDFQGDSVLIQLTLLLLGLGTAVQFRLGTWATEWSLWRTYLPYAIGVGMLLITVKSFNISRLSLTTSRFTWCFWILAILPLVALLLFGRKYRGGIFLPGNINPSELTKVFLLLFSAGWLPKHIKGLSRTLMGLPFPPLKECLLLGIAWGIPLFITIIIGDFGMVLILSITLMVLLTAVTRRWGWLIFGTALTALAGWVVQKVSIHTHVRFSIWLDPFADPAGKGYQIGQSLCAQYAGNLWGTGVAQGRPEQIPIVESDFVYAAIAEEWGLVGCGLLLLLYVLWLQRIAAVTSKSPVSQTLSKGIAALLGVQIFLNIAGVTKALPMTGITLPFFSLGGFSLIAVLFLSGLAISNTKQ